MEIKLNVYTTRACINVEKTYSVSDFRLSTGACEDVLKLINIDMFEGGLQALDSGTQFVEIMKMIINGFGAFKDILKDIFEGLTDEEIERTDIEEIVKVVIAIVSYAFNKLLPATNNRKN